MKADGDLKSALQRRGAFGQTLKAVAWSFFGVRKRSEHEKDLSQLNPLHVVVAGLAAAAVFVAALVLLVQWILSSGVAR